MVPLPAALRQYWSQVQAERSDSYLSRWLFLRLLGLIYLIAFISLWTQIEGLIGSNGILPVADYLKVVGERAGAERFWWLPTFCWLSSSDWFLHFQCATGVLLSMLLILGIAPVAELVLLWAIYLSLSTVCRDFLGFQWDILLLETGFLAILLAPRQWLPNLARETSPSLIAIWLCRWLLFRLMFMSGAVKLLSADSAWWNLTALNVHYETQPLPTWIGWHAHQLPEWFQKISVIVMFIIELLMPVLIFGPGRLRKAACASFVFLMVLITLTGNYCFFNLLTVALCVLLLDDAFLLRRLPGRVALFVRTRLDAAKAQAATSHASAGWRRRLPRTIRQLGTALVVAAVLMLSAAQTLMRLSRSSELPRPILTLLEAAAPLRTVNSYGLFAVMTTTRPEIVVEGSNDGVTWLPYEFKWKPGDLNRRPAFVAPHQPRLDWQMWFAALGNYRQNPWFVNFLIRLLQGSSEVLTLLEKNPFPDKPPRYVRAALYEYRFTDRATRDENGAWWRRERKGLYCPEISLRQN